MMARKEDGKLIILISGPHASGKTTVAIAIAERLGLRYISAGEIFRQMAKEMEMSLVEFTRYVESNPDIDHEIDERMFKEMLRGNIVVDSQLAYYFSKKIEDKQFTIIRIMIYADLEERVRRLMEREGVSREEAIEEIRVREESERKRFKELYGIDLWSIDDFDVIINTSNLALDQMVELCVHIIEKIIELKSQ